MACPVAFPAEDLVVAIEQSVGDSCPSDNPFPSHSACRLERAFAVGADDATKLGRPADVVVAVGIFSVGVADVGAAVVAG